MQTKIDIINKFQNENPLGLCNLTNQIKEETKKEGKMKNKCYILIKKLRHK